MSAEQQIREQGREQRETAVDQRAAETAASMSRSRVAERQQNPEFAQLLRSVGIEKSDLSPQFQDILEEFRPAIAGAHATSKREEGHAHKMEWLNKNLVERVLAEMDPGRLLRDNEDLLRIAQGATSDRQDLLTPANSRDRRVARQIGEAKTSIDALAEEGEGIAGLTEATAVHRSETNEQEESSTSKLARFYG